MVGETPPPPAAIEEHTRNLLAEGLEGPLPVSNPAPPVVDASPNEAEPTEAEKGDSTAAVNHFQPDQRWEGHYDCGGYRTKIALCIEEVVGHEIKGKIGMASLDPNAEGRGYTILGRFDPNTGKADMDWENPIHRGGTGLRGSFERDGDAFLGMMKSSSCRGFFLERALGTCDDLESLYPGIAGVAPPLTPNEEIAKLFRTSLENHFEVGQRWGGTADCGEKLVSLTMVIDRVEGDDVAGTLELRPALGQSWKGRGRYHVLGRFSREGGGVRMKAGEWIGEPGNLPRYGFGGYFYQKGKSFIGVWNDGPCKSVVFLRDAPGFL